MDTLSKSSVESITPRKGLKGTFASILPILVSFLLGFYASIQFSAKWGREVIPFGAFAGLFILPPIVGFYFALPKLTDSVWARYLAFITIVLGEFAIWSFIYIQTLLVPSNDGSDEALWGMLQCYMAGIFASFLALMVYSLIQKFYRART